jgi:hypothetical protein
VFEALHPAKRTETSRAYMLGIGYGLNPITILAPAVSVGMYLDPVVIGVEISDSEHMGIWEKERRENFGTSRFIGDTQFVKWFFEDNFYLIAAREHRTLKLWNRTYNRTGSGKALFDMQYDLTLASLGVGLLRFNRIGFLAIDIIRFGFLQKQSVEIVEYWETWSITSGTREPLDNNIRKRPVGESRTSTQFSCRFRILLSRGSLVPEVILHVSQYSTISTDCFCRKPKRIISMAKNPILLKRSKPTPKLANVKSYCISKSAFPLPVRL